VAEIYILQADIYGIFCSAEMFPTFLHEGRELLFTFVFFSTIFFSRNDASGQRLNPRIHFFFFHIIVKHFQH
jgi:hypothetical protein